jgi:hypothetical protein
MRDLIDKPAFIIVTLSNGTTISGRQLTYSDPSAMSPLGAFQMTDSDGVTTYLHGGAIAHVTVFPLDSPSIPVEK